jgi:hypothetical protein
MTRERIAEGLELLTLQLANNQHTLPDGWTLEEWIYIKGIASHAIWTTRARFLTVGQA